jgi:signal transduction histidine kinase
MINTSLPTRFAPPGRHPVESLKDQPERVALCGDVLVLDRLPLMAFVANDCRQLVYGNPSFTRAMPPDARRAFIGRRPGEALGCVHAHSMEAGCGCSEYCRHCGAALAILKSLQGEEDCRECHILARNGQGIHALDLQILSRPLEFQGQIFSLNVALDVSHERRLLGLERTFLHSMINAAGGMETMFALLDSDQGEELLQHVPLLRRSALAMLQQVQFQYDLMASETGRLEVRMATYDMRAFVGNLARQIRGQAVARNREVTFQGPACAINTDGRLLRHVLSSLVVNGLEAVGDGRRVRISWSTSADGITIDVENSGSVPQEISAQFFKRYVSTKGEDRGLGLYVAKVFTENHLGGRLTYTALPETTRFRVFLPQSASVAD